ncbi:hypothetical protein J2T20_004531 [Paenibacillus wynnii]|nr:hypothetical protein [Paenibacillus wynnii]
MFGLPVAVVPRLLNDIASCGINPGTAYAFEASFPTESFRAVANGQRRPYLSKIGILGSLMDTRDAIEQFSSQKRLFLIE